jgi:PAS domain S-box-containing protein
MLFLELIYNLSTLVALSVISAFLDDQVDRNTIAGQILQGILFGTIAILGMMFPLTLEQGLIFDGRTVALSLCGLFYGPISGGIASLLAGIYRIRVGGPGLTMGIITILTSTQFGILFHYWYVSNKGFTFTKRHLLALGVLVHGAMLLYNFLLPGGRALPILLSTGPTIALIYPVATVLIGKILMDQIEKKKSLQDLRYAAQRYRITLESIGDAVITTDTECKVEFLNPVAERLTGWHQEEARGKPLSTVFYIVNEETRHPVENPVSRVLQEGIVVGLANHTVLISRDGKEFPIADSGAPIKAPDGKTEGVVLVFRDQTEERVLLQQLVENERKYRSLFQSTNDGIALHQLITDASGQPVDYIILDVNPLFEKLLGLERDAVIGKKATVVYNQERAPFLDIYARTAQTGELYTFEEYFAPMDKHFHITVFSPAPGQFATVFQDITERKQIALKVLQELEEKKVLIREIHHRVKNNLQVILSFIRLRIAKLNIPTVQRELRELENRIHAMAHAQELLYESPDFIHLGLKRYLTDIIDHLLYSNGDVAERIHLSVDIQDIHTDIDTALVLGHVITELLFNVFNHAFPEEKSGEVRIRIVEREQGVLLEFEDNGVGVPSGTRLEDIADTGLEIVFGYISRQQGGSVTYETSSGLQYRIFLPYQNSSAS